MRRFFRITYYAGVILLFLLVVVAGLTQTRWFKSSLRTFLLQNAGTVLRGELAIGRIDGNLITGFQVHGIGIRMDGVNILSAERLDVRYDPLSLPFNRIALSQITLVRPTIRLIRRADGTWNVERLIVPAKKDTPSRTSVELKLVELVDGRVTLVDSLRLIRRQETGDTTRLPDQVDYARLDLDSLSLAASAQITPGTYSARIRQCSFASLAPRIFIRNLQVDASLTPRDVEVRNLEIETARSHVRARAAIREVDVTSLKALADLGATPVELDLTAEPLDTRELKQFLYPWVDFLDGSVVLRSSLRGTFGRMRVHEMAVRLGETSLRLEGTLEHVHHPVDLTMDLTASRNVLRPADLQTFLPGLNIPDLTCLGDTQFDLRYIGHPTDFRASIDASCAAGDLRVDGALRVERGTLVYNADVQTREADLSVVTGIDRLTSRLNARLTINGQGTDPQSMVTVARLEVDSSSVANLPVRRTVLVIDAADGIIRSHGAVSAGSTRLSASGVLHLPGAAGYAYDVDARVNSMDLAELLEKDGYESDLSFAVKAGGSVTRSTQQDSLRFEFNPSMFGDESFEGGTIDVAFRSSDSLHQTLRVRSDACDADVDGTFSTASFIGLMPAAVRLLAEAVAYRVESLDSLRVLKPRQKPSSFRTTVVDRDDRIDAHYSVRVKDFHPLGALLTTTMEGTGSLRGSIRGSLSDLRLEGVAAFPAIVFGEEPLSATEATAEYSFAGINRDSIVQSLRGRFQATARMLSVGAEEFAGPMLECTLLSDSIVFSAGALIDSLVLVQTSGSGAFRDHLLDVRLSHLTCGIGDLSFNNSDPLHCRIGQDGFFFDQWRLEQEAEDVRLNGYFSPGGVSDATVQIRGFLLTDLSQILRRSSLKKTARTYAGIVQATATFRGSFDHPNISLQLLADGVRAQETVFGRISGRASYFEHKLDLLVRLDSRPDRSDIAPDLLLSGTLPFNLTLSAEPPHPLEGNIDLTLQSQGVDLAFLDPFVPEVSGLTGTLVCDMKMRGPVDAPRYEGSMVLKGARFFFRPIGIWYRLDGSLLAAGDRLDLEGVTIRNTPEDRPDGLMNVTGRLTLFGLTFREFDLLARGQLLVMKEESRQPGQKFFGRLFVAAGGGGLHWQGNLTQSSLKGDLGIKQAQLTFPPEREVEVIRARSISVTYVNDTLHASGEQRQEAGRRSRNGRAASGVLALAPDAAEQPGFLDRINYDIALETQGPAQLRIVFNSQTSEELFADLQGRMYFFKTPAVSRLTGSVEVSDRSYYNFIKKFQVSEGKLLFTGDPLNPELDISAKYEGIHRIDSTYNPTQAGKEEKVAVILKISGTRNEPKPSFSIERDGKKQQTGEEESDAISFILGGQFRNELTDQQRAGLLGTNLGFGLASGMLTGPLSDLLRRETGIIQSVDVLYYGGGSFEQSADLRLTGQVGEAVIRLGGRVLNDINNTNASVELPMSSITGMLQLRNLILTLERRVETVENVDERRRASNGARLYYRIAF